MNSMKCSVAMALKRQRETLDEQRVVLAAWHKSPPLQPPSTRRPLPVDDEVGEEHPLDDIRHSIGIRCSRRMLDKTLPRDKWANKFEFLLSCIGYSVGLGNIWRFPYLCYQNGGGAFLIPYILSLVFCGVPMFVLECSWGQLLSVGGLGMWKLCPIFKGVGIAAAMCAFWLDIYYIVVLAWAIMYFVNSFGDMPWRDCSHSWNTPQCQSEYGCKALNESIMHVFNVTELRDWHLDSFNHSMLPDNWTICQANFSSPVKEFWERKVLEISPGIDHPGNLRWELALSLLAAWILCYFAIFKGCKWTGKVLYVTALFPYLLLTILLIRGLTLPGAAEGLSFYLYPDFSKLANSKIWIDAVTQIFFTYGLALGAIVALGSYNKYHNSIVKQATFICILDSSTSFFAGFIVFSFIGFMATEQGQPVSKVAESGPGLLFRVYPSGLLQLPGTAFWSALFFLTIILIGIDSQFCTMEGFFTAVIDEWPQYLRKRYRRECFILIICVISYFIGLSTVTQGGLYVFQVFDYYGASGWVLLWLLFFECIAISWCYGLDKWYENLKDMVGYYPSSWWRFCWKYACPAVCFGVTIFTLVQYKGATLPNYTFPVWADVIGWLIALSSMLWVPGYAIYLYCITPGTFKEKYAKLVSPQIDIREFRTAIHGTDDSVNATELLAFRHNKT